MKTQTLLRRTLFTAGLCACLGTGMGLASAVYAAEEPKPHSDGIGAAMSDTVITGKVKAKFADDTRLKNARINVTTTNGVVTLAGSAPSSDAASAAKDLAAAVEGVKSVDNQVNTPSVADRIASKTDKAAEKTGKFASDSWITTKVKSDLLADSITKGLDISVKTRNGVVALSGSVTSEDAIDHAKDIARNVEGVKSVDTAGLKATGRTS